MKPQRIRILSLTKKDFQLEFFRAGGKGGQKQNKTSSACRIRHPASGAVAECREERSQVQNKRIAFVRLVESRKFQAWLKLESARRMGLLEQIEKEVIRQMGPGNIRVEGKDKAGRWVEIKHGGD